MTPGPAPIAVRICRAQNVRHTGDACQLAGRRCRWVRADWLAGEDVEGVPVLRPLKACPSRSLSSRRRMSRPSNSVLAWCRVQKVRSGSSAHVSRVPNSWPAKTPPGASARRIRAHRAGKSCGGQNGRLKPAWIRCARGKSASANDDCRTRIRPTVAGGMRARSDASPAGSASTARTSQPRASNSSASVPSPQPRSIAMRSWPAPSSWHAASSSGRGSRPADHA